MCLHDASTEKLVLQQLSPQQLVEGVHSIRGSGIKVLKVSQRFSNLKGFPFLLDSLGPKKVYLAFATGTAPEATGLVPSWSRSEKLHVMFVRDQLPSIAFQ